MGSEKNPDISTQVVDFPLIEGEKMKSRDARARKLKAKGAEARVP
jgi:hypothetical protein